MQASTISITRSLGRFFSLVVVTFNPSFFDHWLIIARARWQVLRSTPFRRDRMANHYSGYNGTMLG